jgi:uncharacterized protein (DUF1800 family)
MELFVLGVGRYTEDDVKAAARALTGYQVEKSSGVVTFNAKRYDAKLVTILGTAQVFTGDTLSDFLVARDDNATFIAERLWYRFISSTESMPTSFSAKKALAGRDIAAAVTAMANDPAATNDRDIKQWGRWSSDSYLLYTRLKLKQKETLFKKITDVLNRK